MSNLSAVQLHAIAVVAKQAAAVRGELKDGKNYRPEFAVMLRGELRVGNPTPTTQTKKADALFLLAALLEVLGPRKRVQVVSELIERAEQAKIADIDPAAVSQAERLVRDTTTRKSATSRGNVTGTFDCELL